MARCGGTRGRGFLLRGALLGVMLTAWGCGGGSGGHLGDSTGTWRLAEGGVLLPQDGTVVIDTVTATSVTLLGDALPEFEVGQTVASVADGGLLRRIVGITPIAGGVVLATEPGNLGDLLESADLAFEGAPAGYTFDPAPGVTLAPASGRQTAGTVVIAQFGQALQDALRAAGLTDAGVGQATAELALPLSLSLKMKPAAGGGSELEAFEASAGLDAGGEVYVTVPDGVTADLNLELPIGRITGLPVLLGPIVFTPQADVFWRCDGDWVTQGRWEARTPFDFVASAGASWANGAWTPQVSPTEAPPTDSFGLVHTLDGLGNARWSATLAGQAILAMADGRGPEARVARGVTGTLETVASDNTASQYHVERTSSDAHQTAQLLPRMIFNLAAEAFQYEPATISGSWQVEGYPATTDRPLDGSLGVVVQ